MKRFIKLLVSLLVYLADAIGGGVAAAFGSASPGRCAVLYYHEVVAADRNRFAAQLDAICREAAPVCALTAARLEKGRKYFSITVDDAFISFFKNGLPELERRRIPVSVFVPTAWLGRRVDWAMEEVMASPNEHIATLAELRQFAGHPLVRIGSHTVNHRKLGSLGDPEAFRELSESRAFLERELGGVVDAVSFPYGGFTARDVQLAARAGYRICFTTEPKITRRPGEGVVGRFRLDPSDWILEARLKAAGAYRWQSTVQRWRSRWRGASAGTDAAVPAACSV